MKRPKTGLGLLLLFLLALGVTGGMVYRAGQQQKLDSALIIAISDGNLAAVRSRLTEGADVNARDMPVDTPLCVAVLFNNIDCVKLFLTKGAQTNIRDLGEYTPLMLAQQNHNAPIIALLMKVGEKE